MPGLAECDSSRSRRWVVRQQTAMGLHVAGLWRYRAKTLAGEPFVDVGGWFTGIFGDRAIWIVGPRGRTSRRHYRLLGLRGTLSAKRHVLINGYLRRSREALALVTRAAADDDLLAPTRTAYSMGLLKDLPTLH